MDAPRVKVAAARTVIIEMDGDYDGARVQCSSDVSIRTLLRMKRLTDHSDEEAFDLLREFGDTYLLDWNLDGADDKPLPTTGEGFLSLPLPLMFEIIARWAAALTVPSVPLVETSPGGEPLPEQSIPMVAVSGSPAN